MSIVQRQPLPDDVSYPDSDGRPMGETPRHIRIMLDTFVTLEQFFASSANVFLAANMFLYYVRGNNRKHVSPDVFLVWGIPKFTVPERRSYRTWEEGGKGPDFVLEVTSLSTRREDQEVKMLIYQDTLRVKEYFLFDPYAEYLQPPLMGYRLVRGRYTPIKAAHERLPSKVLGLHLERDDADLRLYDPARQQWLPTPREEAEREAERANQAEAALQQAQDEVERLRRELERLRKKPRRKS
jgi:Uma2 family endonuclease